MNFASTASWLILVLAKETLSITPDIKNNFDITNPLNDTIAKILLNTINHDTARSLLDEIKYHRSTHEIENTAKLEPFGAQIYLNNIEVRGITYSNSDKVTESSNPSMYYNYVKNEIGVFHKKISFKVYGYLGAESKSTYVGFRATLEYKDFKINATKTGEKFDIDIDGILIGNKVRVQHWTRDETNTTITTTPYGELEDLIKVIDSMAKYRIPHDIRKKLTNMTKSMMPSILFDNINHNDKFLQAINASFLQQPKQKLISTYPDLLSGERQYHFSIRNFSILDVNLSDIKVRGLWNLEWLYVKPFEDHGNNYTINVLFIWNISGSMNWDHGYENVEPLKVYFSADCISLLYHQGIESIAVRTANYSVTRVGQKLIETDYSSTLSKNTEILIATAIGSSMLPSMNNERKLELENNFTKIHDELSNWFRNTFNVTQQSPSQKTIQQIPRVIVNNSSSLPPNNFTSYIVKSKIPPKDAKIDEKSTPEPYNYHISFPNVTIKLVSANPNTSNQLQCDFFNSEFSRQINAAIIGALHLKNNKNNSIALNFHCDFNSMNLSIVKPSSSDKNGTCEFQIANNQNIKVELPPTKNITDTKDELEIKKKIDATLLSTVTQSIARNMKSVVCYPLDICTQSVKLIDHFVLQFVDSVLKKCSLRRNNTTIT